MNLTCPACGAPFSADDVHPELGIANCRVCRGVLDLRAPDRPIDRPRPARFSLDESDGRMVIEWRWFRTKNLAMIPFALFWCGFLFFWYQRALTNPRHDELALLFPLLHVGVGLWLVYGIASNLVNRTRIVADDGGITITHGPLPARGRRVERATLAQLFSETVRGNRGSISFALAAVDSTGKRVRLVRNFDDADEPKWLEAVLERRLGIRNRPVAGELDTERPIVG